MTAAFATDYPADFERARRKAATMFGVRMLGVIAGFTRGVFLLGLEMGSTMIRLANAGKDPHSDNTGFDLAGVLRLLRRALHMADAIRVRLRTPAVIDAMRRNRSERTGEAKSRPPADLRSPMAQALWGISFMRRDKKMCAKWQQAIAGMSDHEVLARIYGDLKEAAALLGETVEMSRIEKLARRAGALLQRAEEAEAEAEASAMRRADRRAPDAAPEPEPELERDGVAGARPPHAAGCGPP